IEVDGTWDVKDAPIQNPHTAETAYEISHCMTCGCCLEACPNVGPQSDFIGPSPTVQAYLFNLHPLGKFDAPTRLNALMEKGGITSCGNSQNCVEACPKNIKLTTYLAQLNRDVNKQALKNIFNK
ncbi:MAG: succinate dehydrogenase iron-sulfur subunit, partial [Selenomonas sp.]|nr:succinate dehydrogenase iron-sulfur subunit [Selenomonas sp.]